MPGSDDLGLTWRHFADIGPVMTPSIDEAPAPALSPDEVRYFIHALVAARDSFSTVARDIAQEFGISRRGPWIIGMIGRAPSSPNDLAVRMRITPSLVTAELNTLQRAGLIRCERSARDGRRIDLSLTPKGDAVNQRLSEELSVFLCHLTVQYPRGEILAAAALLNDLANISNVGASS